MKEKKECTFKPKINEKYSEENKKQNRFEMLYQQGASKRTAKKDKTREELDSEKHLDECTFKPDINKKY